MQKNSKQTSKGPPIKDVRSQAGFVQCRQRGRGVLQMQTSALSGAKKLGFFEIYGVSARTRGELVRTYCRQGEGGGNFSQFCAGVFYGRNLFLLLKIARHVLSYNFFLICKLRKLDLFLEIL